MDFDKLIEYQNNMKKRLTKEVDLNKKLQVLSIINQMSSEPSTIIKKQQVISECEKEGLTSEEVNRYIRSLINDRIVYEYSSGSLKKY